MNWLFCLYTTLIMIISTKEDPTKFIAFSACCSSIKTRQTDKRHHRSRLKTDDIVADIWIPWVVVVAGGKLLWGFDLVFSLTWPDTKSFQIDFLHVEISTGTGVIVETGSLLLGVGPLDHTTIEWWVAKEINCWHKSRSNVNNMANWFNWCWWLE